QIVDQAVGILEARMLHPGAMLSTLSVISSYLMLKLSDYEQQVFGCIFLDSKQRIVEDAVLFKGTLNICPAYPRVIVQEALKRPAVNVIVYRNDLEWEMDAYSIPLNIGPEARRSEEHTSELQSRFDLVCRLLLEKYNVHVFH